MRLLDHVVAATDFSEASRGALEAAALFALQNRARVTLVHVLAVDQLGPGEIEQSTLRDRELEAAVHQHLDRIRADVFGEVEDVKTVVLRSPSAPEAICELAGEGDADLVVVGTHGRTGLARFLIGSVSERVVRHAPCPVLAIRAKAGSGPLTTASRYVLHLRSPASEGFDARFHRSLDPGRFRGRGL